jgi:hypothetical protein
MLHPDAGTQAILEYLCSESNKVYNCSLYYARQLSQNFCESDRELRSTDNLDRSHHSIRYLSTALAID